MHCTFKKILLLPLKNISFTIFTIKIILKTIFISFNQDLYSYKICILLFINGKIKVHQIGKRMSLHHLKSLIYILLTLYKQDSIMGLILL